jgi:hypothetical protein
VSEKELVEKRRGGGNKMGKIDGIPSGRGTKGFGGASEAGPA